ncbi:MAG: hypothetical protein HGJ94_18415 [Desulfosarcina sp.]|nr:hypothetical protein [Desulfosarcina sp.]
MGKPDQESSIKYIYEIIRVFGFSPEQALCAVFSFKWKLNKAACAREMGISHTTVNNLLSGEIRSGPAADRFFSALGINNPWGV